MTRIREFTSRQAGAAIVLTSVVVGVVAGVAWVLLAPSADQVHADSSLAASVDAAFGAVTAVAGAVTGLMSALLLRRHGIALTVGVVAGALVGSVVALGVGLLLGEPMVRALPMLLMWPMAALVAEVAVGVAVGLGPDPHHVAASATDESSAVTPVD